MRAATGTLHKDNEVAAPFSAKPCSAQRLDIVRLSPTPIWELKAEDGLRLEGAHGEEIVRCLYIDEKVSNIRSDCLSTRLIMARLLQYLREEKMGLYGCGKRLEMAKGHPEREMETRWMKDRQARSRAISTMQQSEMRSSLLV